MKGHIDKLGVLIAILAAYGAWSPFASLRANRIVQGEGFGLFSALPAPMAWLLVAIILMGSLVALFRREASPRILAAATVLMALAALVGEAAAHLTPSENNYARVAPATGFWLLLFAFSLLAADGISRMRPDPKLRLAYLIATVGILSLIILSGAWTDLSVMKEYAARDDVFWREASRHLALALGSLGAAALIGIPLGVVCERVPAIRATVLTTLNLVQTIPSIALFGILIAPLGWLAIHVPGAYAIGIRGIGAAPAFVALFLYSMLPMVANTVAGLAAVPRESREAARGLGMTSAQRLFQVEFPLALPVILTAIRIVLVQNIGLATIAALIGGGGFGTFVFQGLGQMATDLVLLGALPTVGLAFFSAVVLDALIDMNSIVPARKEAR
ncbi:ABC transporter permease [Rhizobium halophilum]|uniref:ABC transporter permease n=1 Tax=Rhizobium halophilum TaxID=2846852 RepID=UPI001EFD9709|nr:ABC transporter permease [Rhizobium halophilum]MCF6368569.1 ABC transporter permease [Rhizobium halophilum]